MLGCTILDKELANTLDCGCVPLYMKLLDVTLREGEQRAGHEYTIAQKVTVAQTLSEFGIDYIQLGFPVADDDTKRVCERLDIEARTTGIARSVERDIVAAADAGVDVIDLFAPTSDRQRKFVLEADREELKATVTGALDHAHETDCEVHFTAMDGFRTDPAFLSELIAETDAKWITIADTVGGCTPQGTVETLEALDVDLSQVGVHFHDDLGMATANALAAADCGVGKVDVTVAGIGERAGNTPLEELVAAVTVGEERAETSVDTEMLLPTAQSVLDTLCESVASQKPLLGAGVFEHESGLHTAAMLDEPSTFEPFAPATFGGERHLLFGAATGRGAARRLLVRVGREPTDERIERLLNRLANGEEEQSLAEAMAEAESVR